MQLNDYLQQVYALANDEQVMRLNPDDLTSYINIARRQVAIRTQGLRILTPTSGRIQSINVLTGGSGYSTASVTISPPDFPSARPPIPLGSLATATPVITSGSILYIDLTYGGDGYFTPTVSITGNGIGATASAVVTGVCSTITGQEVYPLSSIDLSAYPGYDSVFGVRAVSVIFNNCRYTLSSMAFSEYQAWVRNWALNYQYVPSVCALNGIGTTASLYLFPVPSAAYQLEIDGFCLPIDLTGSNAPEAIPEPYTDLVQYYALVRVYQHFQNFNAANYYSQQFDQMLKIYAGATNIGQKSNTYGRPIVR